GTDVYFQHLKLENRNISTPGRGNFYGYNISVNGDHILAFDGVTTVTGEVSGCQRNAIAQISAVNGTVRVSSCSLIVSGAVTANDLVIGGYGTVLTVYGGTAVRNRLMLDSPAKIVLRGESRLNDIRSDRNTNVLQFSRLKGDKPSLTMSGNVTGAGVTFCLEPLYYAAFDKPAETLTAKPDGAAAAYLLPYTDGVTQALPENRLLFKAPELEMSKFTYQESESSGLSLYKANGGYYASADEAMARYAVTMSGTTYLDMNQAVQRINEIGDIGKTYTIAFRQDLKDTNRTDKNDCSALPTARDNAAAQVYYSSQGGNHGLYFSGSPVLYEGAAEDREDEIRFTYVYLRPSEVKYAGGEPVPAADGTVTIQIRRNSRSKAHVMLNLLMSNVEGTALKAITGVRGVTELDLNLKNYVKEMVITDGITNFDQVSVAQYNRICMNKISNVGSLKLGRLSRLIVTGTGSVDQIVVDSGTDNHPTLCVSFTQKGSGNNITRKPNFTVNGEIRAANRKLLVIEPLRSVFVNDDGIAEAISPLNYLRTETITDEYDYTSEVPIGRRNYTVTGTDQMGLPLINAKRANPEWITIDWNGLDERYLAGGIPQRSLGNAPDGVTPYKDMNGDILMTKTSDMPITITGFAADENDEKTLTAKVHTWEEAVKLIDARASGKDRYEVSFNPGEYGMGKGGAVSAMLWPKAANADHVELLDGNATDDDQPVLNYTGALNPACSVRFTQVCLCEYSNATTVSQTNSINTSNAVCIGFDHAMTQDPESGYLEFDKVTAKKGTIRLDKTLLISYGTVDVAAMELCSAGNEYAMLTTDYAPAVSDIKVSDVTVYGVAGFYGNGKITLGTIRGGSMESGGWTPVTGEPVSGTDWEDVLWVDATFSAVKPENSVSQLTISGRVEGVTLAVHPYLYDWDANKYGDVPTLQEMRERGLIYTGDANKAPAKGTQLLNAPYLNLTDLLVKTSTPDPEDPTTDFYLYGYGYADDYEVDADHPGEWLTWYKGSVYVTDLPATVDVEDTDEENCKYYPGWNGRMDENSTRFTNWEQAVAYVDKAAREDHSYEMCLRDDVGVISWRTVEERGVVKGREPAAVAKTFVMPKTKLADSLTIKTADDHPVCGFHSSATSLTVNGDVVLEDIGLNSLKVNKDSVTMQDLNFMVSAGSRLCLRGEITGSRIGNITGTATSGLSVEMKGNLAVNGGIRAFESVVLNGCDAYVNGEVNVKDLEMSGAELHAANITATGLTELSYGHGWNPEDRNYSIHRPSTLAADMDEAAGKGVVTLNNVNSAVGMSLLGGRFEGNNIVSKLGVRGQSQLTIKGTVSHWLMGEEQDGGSSLCISFLYGRGNETYAVLLRDQVLVNCVNTAQAEGVAHRVCLGYASSDPNEWRGNEGKVSGISDPVLTVPVKGKTVIVTGP
ncbi:MAG: hypothetical protein IKO80_06095, partial [Lachnospiraceae bacterium]|nr:hypothetical protein [Lachnospiraceae bacterium]